MSWQHIRIFLALCAASWSGLAFASEAKPLITNYVYQLTSNKGQIAYLFGSAHISISRVPIHLGQCVKKLLSGSTGVQLEVDQLEIRLMHSRQPKTVSMSKVVEFIDKSTLESLTTKMYGREAGGDTKLQAADAFALLTIVMARIPDVQSVLGIPDFGPDTEIAMAARFLDIPVGFVESPQEQLQFFQAVPPADFASAIVTAFNLTREPQGAHAYFRSALTLMQAAAEGNEKAIADLMESDGFSGYYKATILARNPSLAAKLDATISRSVKSPNFFALGAAHLGGDGGVVQRLAARGYQVSKPCD